MNTALLAYAAAPTFLLMALWTGISGSAPDIFCVASSPLNGMTAMYLLMAVFHAGPWLKMLRLGPA